MSWCCCRWSIFLALAGLFLYRLGSGDPSRIPSALIGHAAPHTDLPPIPELARDGKPMPGVSNADLRRQSDAGECLGLVVRALCRRGAVPGALSKDKRIQLVGINYKDAPDNARRFLNRYGNPFVGTGQDESGRAGIDWGVYGVPETFVVGRDGHIAYKLVGPITAENLVRVPLRRKS